MAWPVLTLELCVPLAPRAAHGGSFKRNLEGCHGVALSVSETAGAVSFLCRNPTVVFTNHDQRD